MSRAVALRRVVVHLAAERLGHLDAHDHGHLALVDHAPGLVGVGHDPVEALARAAGLRVDVVLHLAHPPGLEADGVHLVTGVLLERVDLAQDRVLDQQVHEHPLARPPRALEPLVVALLVGQRLGRGPVLERRPAGGIVRPRGVAVREHVLDQRGAAPCRLVVGAVDQRLLDPVPAPRLAAVGAAAQELEGHAVHVRLQEARRLGVGGRALRGRAGHADLDLGELAQPEAFSMLNCEPGPGAPASTRPACRRRPPRAPGRPGPAGTSCPARSPSSRRRARSRPRAPRCRGRRGPGSRAPGRRACTTPARWA